MKIYHNLIKYRGSRQKKSSNSQDWIPLDCMAASDRKRSSIKIMLVRNRYLWWSTKWLRRTRKLSTVMGAWKMDAGLPATLVVSGPAMVVLGSTGISLVFMRASPLVSKRAGWSRGRTCTVCVAISLSPTTTIKLYLSYDGLVSSKKYTEHT